MSGRPPPSAGPQDIPRPEHWRLGTPHEWPRPTQQRVAAVLDDLPPIGAPTDGGLGAGVRHSAVLALLAPSDEGPSVLLTRRSLEMNHHSGEVCFAGGRIDPGETPVQAALREADEEVGLDPAAVTVRGELNHLSTWVSNSAIVPVVATVPEVFDLTARTIEVDRVLWVPLADLTRPGVFHTERWERDGIEVEVGFFELFEPHHETVWGATARMLVDFLDRL